MTKALVKALMIARLVKEVLIGLILLLVLTTMVFPGWLTIIPTAVTAALN